MGGLWPPFFIWRLEYRWLRIWMVKRWDELRYLRCFCQGADRSFALEVENLDRLPFIVRGESEW